MGKDYLAAVHILMPLGACWRLHYEQLKPADITLLDDLAAVSGSPEQAIHAYRSDPRVPAPSPLTDGYEPKQ